MFKKYCFFQHFGHSKLSTVKCDYSPHFWNARMHNNRQCNNAHWRLATNFKIAETYPTSFCVWDEKRLGYPKSQAPAAKCCAKVGSKTFQSHVGLYDILPVSRFQGLRLQWWKHKEFTIVCLGFDVKHRPMVSEVQRWHSTSGSPRFPFRFLCTWASGWWLSNPLSAGSVWGKYPPEVTTSVRAR